MQSFKELILEATVPKIKKNIILDLSAKIYSTSIPLCREIDKDIKKVCDLIEKDGYYLLGNTKSDKNDVLISPEDLAKIPGATEAISYGQTYKIGRSLYNNTNASFISNKTYILTVEGEEVTKPVKNPKAKDGYYFDAQLLKGLGLIALTKYIATAHSKDNVFGGYFSKDGESVLMLGSKGTVKVNKPVVAWFQQHSTQKWKVYSPGQLVYKEVPMSRLFPSAFKKSTINKKDIFVIK